MSATVSSKKDGLGLLPAASRQLPMIMTTISPVVPEVPGSDLDFMGLRVPMELQRFYAGQTRQLGSVLPYLFAPDSSGLAVRSGHGFLGLTPTRGGEALLTTHFFPKCAAGIPATEGEAFPGSLVENPDLLGSLYAPLARPWDEYAFDGSWQGDLSVDKENGVELETSGGTAAGSTRLRKRGKWTHQLAVLGSELARGWWRDLPSGDSPAQVGMNFLMKFLAPGTKLGVVNQVRVVRDEVPELLPIVEVLFSSENGSRPIWVCPMLVASLFTVRCFRPVDAGLLASLRSRARLWARDLGMSDLDLAFILPGSVLLAALPQPDEVVALGALRSSAAVFSATALRGLEDGTVARSVPARTFWGTLRVIFGGGDDAINQPVCDRLNLGSK
uniref:Uncharacterized protein n=1 Tax=Macrophomina phaseolina umbra-like virus 3 TaxID=2741667 RepID=A0A7U3W8K6_9TOMB|nr:hypothetical protein [Macrophomina phaseolina umbra-like virus 3]